MNAAFEGTNPNQLSDHQSLMHETQPMNHDAAPAPQYDPNQQMM